MLTFTLKRLLSGVILLVVVATGTFFLAHAAIPDPTLGLLGSAATPEAQAALAQKIGTDRPVLVQFGEWFSNILRGDFGVSWKNFQPVSAQLALKLPVTLSVVTAAILLSALLGATLGVLAGLRPNSWIDRVVKAAAVILFALPGFWVALVLVMTFAVNLRMFPAVGYVQPTESVGGWLQSITLPAIALALGAVVMIAEQLRNAIIQADQQDYMRTLRSRGLPGWRLVMHLLRNAAPASLTILALMFVGLLSGAIIVEQIFALPGIGPLTQASSQNGDIPMLLGITVITVVFVVIVNFLLDILLGWINPKARVK
ncbi:ABC transporter permease [Leucobacter luti]|uniref:Peptide/nickel transport system permease protein n=1 Tax=Leucobacter luti TaxID=340320 RepID=A0A4Q7U7C8_9MICO|nr:ABC transporter permease [Leucobacter luti]MBL3701029.1 ABC transporter permease [Leucobacter luti]RZT68750.1 peptide/nickel transport system permease protein [Leucobacter luti]